MMPFFGMGSQVGGAAAEGGRGFMGSTPTGAHAVAMHLQCMHYGQLLWAILRAWVRDLWAAVVQLPIGTGKPNNQQTW